MIIDCISDLHGYFPKLEGGDLLIVAGDFCSDSYASHQLEFLSWIQNQNYKKKVFVAGNHDTWLEGVKHDFSNLRLCYLSDSGTEFEGLKIWGSPWTKSFEGMNPNCKAFTLETEKELEEKWELIPDDTDILITHSPPFGCFDVTNTGESVGSLSLWMTEVIIRPKLHVFGHIHEAYGNEKHHNGIYLINASYVNRYYKPGNPPIRVVL